MSSGPVFRNISAMTQQHPVVTTQEIYEQRRKNALIVISVQMVISIIGLAIGLSVYLMTENEKAGAFWCHATLALGSLLLLVGVSLRHSGRSSMVAGTVFCVIGIVLAFIGTVVDGVQGGHVEHTEFERCEYSEEAGTAQCGGGSDYSLCDITYPAQTCYCCYIFRDHNCDGWGFSLSTQPDQYRGVSSCNQVGTTYKNLVWTSMICNVLNIVLSIMACAMVSSYKQSLQYIHPVGATYPTQVPIMMPPSYTMAPSHPHQGPVVIYTQQQSVGYYPALFQSVPPPAYSPIMPISSGAAVGQTSQRDNPQANRTEPSAPTLPSLASGDTRSSGASAQPKPGGSTRRQEAHNPRERDLISPPPPYEP